VLPAEWRELLSLIPGYDSEATAGEGDYFDEGQAELALSFFAECLQFIEGDKAGEPFQLEPWQAAIVAALWGWRREDGSRRYRECLLYVPRKSGKTPLAAGLLLLSAFCDAEPGAQLYAAAASKEQSALLFRHAAGMVNREPALASRAKVYKSFKTIEFPDTNSIFRALASDADNLHGLNASFVVVDELHAHPNSDLVDVLVTATASRSSPLILYITTADYNRPSICNSKHAYATAVRDGTHSDSSFLPVIYEAGIDEDWTDPKVWAKSNPNLGVSVRLDYLARECERAKAEPSYEGVFRRLHLNQRTNVETRFVRASDWQACRVTLPDLKGRDCFAGLDLSSTTDLSAFVLAFPATDTEPLYLLPFFWLPEARLRDKKDRLPYEALKRSGHLKTTPGDVVDYDFIRRDIVALAAQYNLREIRSDPWNSIQLLTQLAEQDGIVVTHLRQGFVSMSAPTKELSRLIVGKMLGHGGHPILDAHIGNLCVKLDPAGNLKPDKSKATERIDGAVATIGAISGVVADINQPSVYQSRGLLTL
jgi:phage terminase large subunit-like protein